MLIAGLVTTATVAASAVFLAQRDLSGFCDGAAIAVAAAATTADGNGEPVIDPARIDAAVDDATTADAAGDGGATGGAPAGVRTTVTATTDGRTVELACTRTVRIPFGAVVGAPDGLVRTVVARARPVPR